MNYPIELSMQPLRFALVLLLTLSGGPAVQSQDSGNREAMADAMSRMMEAMGLLGAGADAARSMSGGTMPSMPGVPGMSAVPGGTQMDQAAKMGQSMLEGMTRGVPGGAAAVPGMGSMPWSGGVLEGLWEAAGGGLLIVQGGNYRLYAPNGAFVDGIVQIEGQQVRMASRRAGFALAFEYALDQGRLVLRDSDGQLFLYRRLVLDGGG
jgi:hypothetical protein